MFKLIYQPYSAQSFFTTRKNSRLKAKTAAAKARCTAIMIANTPLKSVTPHKSAPELVHANQPRAKIAAKTTATGRLYKAEKHSTRAYLQRKCGEYCDNPAADKFGQRRTYVKRQKLQAVHC